MQMHWRRIARAGLLSRSVGQYVDKLIGKLVDRYKDGGPTNIWSMSELTTKSATEQTNKNLVDEFIC